MNKIDFKKEKIPFTQVANSVLFDPNLSAKAKGLYAYLYAKPEGWDFAIDRIAKDFSDGRKGINSGLQELEAKGYLLREKQATGRVLYVLTSQMPQMDIRVLEPDAPKGKVPKRQIAERGTISNKDIKIIKNIKKKESASINYLQNIPSEDMKEFTQKFHASPSMIKDKAEALYLWCESNGKRKRNYKAFLLTAMRKDFEKRKPVTVIEDKPEVKLTAEEKVKAQEQMQKIRENIKKII